MLKTILMLDRVSYDGKAENSTDEEENGQLDDDYKKHIQYDYFAYKCSPKAKSSLCKNFMDQGYCPYGFKCQFAHGPQELRVNMDYNRNYKTKTCHAFTIKGYCCFGKRCNFIHSRAQDLQTPQEKWKTIYSNHRQTLRDCNPTKYNQRSRLLLLLRK